MNGEHQPRRNGRGSSRVQLPLETYLKDISEATLLNADQEKDLAHRMENGDSDARQTMINANLRLVVSIARLYVGKGLDLQDLIEEGNIGLIRAVDGFDPNMGTRFSTYAGYWIQQKLKMALINKANMIRIPAYMYELLAKWRRQRTDLLSTLNREPSDEEVAKALGIPEKKLAIVHKAMRIHGGITFQANDEDLQLEEIAIDRAQIFDTNITGEEIGRMLQQMENIDPREKTILCKHFGIGQDKMTLKAIGEELGITRERVRQIESAAMQKLRELMEVDPDWKMAT